METGNKKQNNRIHIVPYRGYGNEQSVHLRGRVLKDKRVALSTEKDSAWRNLRNAWKRFESDEVNGAKVKVSMNRSVAEVTTNEEGYFMTALQPSLEKSLAQLWHPVDVELLSPLPRSDGSLRETGYVMISPQSARFGIISDMDDTVLQTNATNLLRMFKNVAFGNARTRLPFKGVAAFYQALHEENGIPTNPIYYVSSSPWNLYDLLMEFFHLHHIPIGPLMLRDWGVTSKGLPHKHRDHKLESIRHIMEVDQDLPFILIGDSGQKDPEIYHEVLSLFPKRVLAIYIRNVSRDLERPAAIRELAKKVIEAGSTLILADDTLAAARHSIEQGWIRAEKFPEIVAEKVAEDEKTPVVEKVLKKEEVPTVKVDAAEVDPKEIDGGLIEKKLHKDQ